MLSWSLLLLTPLAQAGVTVLEVGTLFDGANFQGPSQVIIGEDGRIEAVSAAGAPIPEGAVVVSAPGASLSPGLVDAHQHFFSPPMPYIAEIGERGWGKLAEEFMSDMRTARADALVAGVTTTVDLGGRADSLPRWQKKLEDGALLAPRLVAAGPILTAPGGHPHGTIYRGQHDLEEHAVVLLDGTAEEARAAVDVLADSGVALIKLVYDEGAGTGTGAALPRLDRALAEAAIAQAHARGLRAVVHTSTHDEALEMVRAGADGLEHSFPVPEGSPLFAEMAARGVTWTPTLGVFGPSGAGADPALLSAAQDSTRRAARAGVPIAAGTDFPASGGMSMGADLHRELGLLEDAGLTRAEALAAATSAAARKVGEAGDGIGCIAVGCAADLVLWAGDLRAGALGVERVTQVWRDGAPILADGAIADPATFKEKNTVFAPYVYYAPVAGLMLGASGSHFDIADSGVAADLGLQVSLRGRSWVSVGASIPSPVPTAALSARVSYDGVPTSWYGGGNDTLLSDQQTYTPDLVQAQAGLDTQRGRWGFSAELSGDALRTDLDALPGGASGAVALSVARDSRDSPTEPWRGGAVILTGGGGAWDAGGFSTARLDLRRYATPIDWQTLAFRLLAEQASPNTPWWRLPELSSSNNTGRGYLPDRFVDQRMLAAQAELRSRIWRGLGGAVFADVGQVAPRWSALRADGFHASYGFSLRVRINAQVTLCWDFGFGHEEDGARPGMMIVYRSGHPF